MFRYRKKQFGLLCVLVLISCGTIIGNGVRGDPTAPPFSGDVIPNRPFPLNLDFSAPVTEYREFSDSAACGTYTEESTAAEVEAGRLCITNSFTNCIRSKYLYNKENIDGSRFVSFVSVSEVSRGYCVMRVHTVSDVPPEYIGDATGECLTLGNSIPEVCGILD